MPLVLHDDHFDVVLKHLQMSSTGATIRQIQGLFSPPMNERTAQRMLSDLVELGMLTKAGYGGALRYQLRTKPGRFGRVLWFHPDSAGAAAVAPPPEEPVQRRTPRPPRPKTSTEPEALSPSVENGAATPPSHRNTQPAAAPANPTAAHSSQGVGRRLRSAPQNTAASGIAAVPNATSLATSANKARATQRPSPARPASDPSFDVQRSMFDVGRSAALPPQFAKLFASSIPRIIPARNDRTQAELNLQTDAAIEGLTPPEMEAYVPAALAVLDTLTVDQAAQYHITPAQYAAWRGIYPASS